MTEKKSAEPDCGVPNDCTRIVSNWIIVVDNVPTLIMFALGTFLLFFLYWWLALGYALYCALSIVMFWAIICPYCSHFDTKACPCGYGSIAPRYFKRKQGEFPKVFKKNIAIMFPCWLLPIFGGVYMLYSGFSWPMFVFFLSFCIDAFIIIPGISRLIGCKDCEVKDDCPWAK